MNTLRQPLYRASLLVLTLVSASHAWFDETHLAIAKRAGYAKWYNSAGPDITKIKAGELELNNHYVNTPGLAAPITVATVLAQRSRYNTVEPAGHLYGAVLAAVRDYLSDKAAGKYGEYHMAFAAHYIGDLSMPLHNTEYNDFNKKNHGAIDGLVNGDILDHPERIKVIPISIRSEDDLAREVVSLATVSISLGRTLETQDRLPTKDEVYAQLGRSASLLQAVLEYANAPRTAFAK